MNNYCSKSSPGFTLIELIVIIAIVAVLSAIAVPSFVSTTQRFRIMSELNVFGGDMQYARAEAIKQGLPVVMCPSSDGSTCLGTNTWHKGWVLYVMSGTTKTILRVQSTWTNTDTLTGDNVSPYSLTFTRDGYVTGFVTGTNTSATFTAKTTPATTANSKCVVLNKAGRQQMPTQGTC